MESSSNSQKREIRFMPRSPFALALMANVIWGTSFLASKYTLKVWGPFTASALRFALALVGMLLLLPAMGFPIQIPRTKKAWTQIFWVGLTGFGVLYPLQLAGLMAIPSSLSAAIMLSSPLFVVLLSAGFLQEVLSTQKLIAIAIGIIGGIILVNPANLPGNTWIVGSIPLVIKGVFFTLAASLSLAVSVLATRSASKHMDSTSVTFWSMGVGVILLLPFTLLEQPRAHTAEQMTSATLALVFLAVVCSVIAFLMWNRAIKMTNPQNIASTMHFKTPVAVVLGVVVANESITSAVIIGTVLISAAVWLSQYKRKPESTSIAFVTKMQTAILRMML
jgi:drug/metabolite transporter (DMT)-like permease